MIKKTWKILKGNQSHKRDKKNRAINPVRRRERAEIKAMGIKTKKAYRRWQKEARRYRKEHGLKAEG